MCGLAGFFSDSIPPTEEIVRKMASCINHRGPDATGFFIDTTVALIHTRLSIIDLSQNSNQPFTSACGRYKIIFNGEIYNYKDLSAKYSLSLKTTGDTEVIVELYALLGPACVKELNGMFSFVILDTLTRKILLFRDRLGVKPLFYYHSGNTFLFASEIKALLAFPGIKNSLTINHTSVSNFLHFGFIPEKHTIYNEILKFPSGHYAEYSNGTLELQQYWDINSKIKKEIISNETEAFNELQALLTDSVKIRLMSDVPYGTFLSGGIDSSLVTAIAAGMNAGPLKTFSIGFEDSKHNEAIYARNISDYLKTDHHEFILSEKESLNLLHTVIDNFDEPFADSSALPTYIVSKLSSQYVKMVLTGDGGDELFLGYGAYKWANRLNNPILKKARRLIHLLLWNSGNNRYKRASLLFNYKNQDSLLSHIFSQEQYYFSREEVKKMVSPDFYEEVSLVKTGAQLVRELAPDEKQALFDINYYLKDDLLVKVDRSSMFASIEAREPLLDYRIVEFSMNLDKNLKLNQGVQKYLLKKVLYQYIPEHYFDRPKWGFSIPLDKWLNNEFKILIHEYLSEESISKTAVLNFNEVTALKKRFLNGEDFLFNRLWLLAVLNRWLIKNGY